MNTFAKSLVAFLFSSSLYAGIACRGAGNLNLYLEVEHGTFSFNQFCWNPCRMGDGELTFRDMVWAGVRYRLDLTHSAELISPLNSRKLDLFLNHEGRRGTLSSGETFINLTCKDSEEI